MLMLVYQLLQRVRDANNEGGIYVYGGRNVQEISVLLNFAVNFKLP